MTRQIIVTIELHEDGTPEGFCAYVEQGVVIDGCSEWDDGYCSLYRENCSLRRCNRCLAAERKLAALIEAGEEMRDHLEGDETSMNGDRRNAWDRAVKEVRE